MKLDQETWDIPNYITSEIAPKKSKYCICIFVINEGQFFEDVYTISIELCEKYGKDVLICGLDGDFQRQTFKYNLLDLIPFADTVEILTAYCAVCKDETSARFSKRISNELEQKVIGSTNYMPVCRKHFLN